MDDIRPSAPEVQAPSGKCRPPQPSELSPFGTTYHLSPRESMSLYSQSPKGSLRIQFLCHPASGALYSKGTLTPTGRVHNGVSISHGKTPQDFRPGGFAHPCPSGGKGLGLYPQITVLRLSNHPAWRDEGGVMNEVKPFSGLPWPGVRGGILPPVSFQP